MSHRRDQKEALRKEREEREKQAREATQRKRMVGYGAGGLLVLAVLVVLVLAVSGGDDDAGGAGPNSSGSTFPDGGSVPEQKVFEVAEAADAAGCRVESEEASGTADHTTSLDEKVNYDTNPPTSGRHYEIPADDGLYQQAPPDEALVHALEHGRVIVWVKPGLPEDQRAAVKALFDEDEYQMLVVPRRDMPSALAATAWNGDPAPNGRGQSLICGEVNEATWDALRAFRDEHRSRGPEPVP